MKLPIPTFGQVEVTTVALSAAVVSIVLYEIVKSSSNPKNWGWLYVDPEDTQGDPNSIGDTSEAPLAGLGVFGIWLNVFNKATSGIFLSLGNEIAGNPWKPGQ